MMRAELFVDCQCTLGEGPLWHPGQGLLFWFDVHQSTLFSAAADGRLEHHYKFADEVSAAGIIDDDALLVACGTELIRLEISSGGQTSIVSLEADKPGNRSNDGKADRQGGFWISTTARQGAGEPTGAVYRFNAGEVLPILSGLEIPNSICFSPQGDRAYLADTPTGRILTATIDIDSGMPSSGWETFVDVEGPGLPDGAVIDEDGCLWSAMYGGGRLVRYAPDGDVVQVVELPVSRATCPAFGGRELDMLFVTTARENMSPQDLALEPRAGGVFVIRPGVKGVEEPPVRLK